MVGLAKVVGCGLEKLQLEIENGSYSLRSLRIILEACPSLRKLVIKPVRIVQEDDELAFAAPDPRVPLQSLTIELTPAFGDSSGIPALCRLVGSYTAELKEFILFAEQRVFADRTAVRFVHELFLQRMPVLGKLRIIGFCSGYLRSLWSRRRASSLRVLMLESVMWNEPDWTAFCAALSDPTHPLAQSLHTLHLKLTGLEALDELHGMLEKNPYLVNVAIDVTQGVRNRPEFMRLAKATDGRQMRHLKKTLSGRHKAALLSATKAANVSIEIQNLVSIFDYAATAETRYVRVHLVTAQRQPMF